MAANTVSITWLHDETECDDCGVNYADGANVVVNGPDGNTQFALSLIPQAACYDGEHYDDAAVLRQIIEKMGYTIEEGSN